MYQQKTSLIYTHGSNKLLTIWEVKRFLNLAMVQYWVYRAIETPLMYPQPLNHQTGHTSSSNQFKASGTKEDPKPHLDEEKSLTSAGRARPRSPLPWLLHEPFIVGERCSININRPLRQGNVAQREAKVQQRTPNECGTMGRFRCFWIMWREPC